MIRRRREEEKRRAQEELRRKAEEERILAEEAARKKKEADAKAAKERELKDEEDRIAREQAERERRAAEKAKMEDELRRKQDEALQKDIVDNHSPDKKAIPSDLESNFSGMQVQQNALGNFKAQQMQDVIEVPPLAESRKFNECDIIGDFERDEKGNVVAGEPDARTGKFKDLSGNETNERGYLIDSKGDVINNLNGEKMFGKGDLDERGEVPAPFNVEKHNFNPHLIRGDFDHDRNGRAIVTPGKGTVSGTSPGKSSRKAGSPQRGAGSKGSPSRAGPEFADKRGSKVSSRGYRIDEDGHLVDAYGRKKFDKAHMTPDGDLPKLFNYNGRRFDIVDTIGQVDKDDSGNFVPETDAKGRLVDKLGRPINSKGYLIDEQGNVIDKDGKQIFENKHLYDDEIPKIFPFTKFNIKNILGDFEMDPLGNPILDKDPQGNLVDRQGRRVNSKGYLIDKDGNVINKNGKKMFDKKLLDADEDIPKVFRTGLLKSDTASSLSRLMDEIERNQPSDFD